MVRLYSAWFANPTVRVQLPRSVVDDDVDGDLDGDLGRFRFSIASVDFS